MVLDKETLELFFNPEPETSMYGRKTEGTNSIRKIQLVQLIKTANRLEDLAFNTIHEDNNEQIRYINLYLKCLGLINQLNAGGYAYKFTKAETDKLNRLGVEDLNPTEAKRELLNRLKNFDEVMDGEIIDGDKFLKE